MSIKPLTSKERARIQDRIERRQDPEAIDLKSYEATVQALRAAIQCVVDDWDWDEPLSHGDVYERLRQALAADDAKRGPKYDAAWNDALQHFRDYREHLYGAKRPA